ncbi:hypothetical protein A3K87_09935 [Variovorax paradoxus]|uniref:Uncharacterized protein n=1 Tax=Variovorax paradoxus TaxID=34073 RepID=A0AA91ID22_VARPD|nr:hypothetical protein [Variovorax paradoxus]OAK66075.1 hypothetical protein A3K87_09935 [Variovorax paradoxus]
MLTRIREDEVPADNSANYTDVGLFARNTVPTEPEIMKKPLVKVRYPHVMPANCLAIEVEDPADPDTRERVRAAITKAWNLD